MTPDQPAHTVVAVYSTLAGAEAAVKAVQSARLESRRLAIVGAAGISAAALAATGLPRDAVERLEVDVKVGRFLVLASGEAGAAAQLRQTLLGTSAIQLVAHPDVPNGGAWASADQLARAEAAHRDGQATRQAILALLSAEEAARVGDLATVQRLTRGEEYLDLAHLEGGVRRILLAMVTLGGVLPRRAVRAQTWASILERLGAIGPAPARIA